MKNQEHSQLYRKYRSLVDEYNTIVDRIIKTKNEMDHFYNYKKDYPKDWKHMAEKLSDDRMKSDMIRNTIIAIKIDIRTSNKNHPRK